MARYALIDGYLETLRTSIRWRSDLDDLVAEMEDHLYSTTEGLCARGFDQVAAQRATLDRFGDPRLVQEAFASNHRGGIAMPTTFTNQAGRLAFVAAGSWLVATLFVGISTWLGPNDWMPWYVATGGAVTIGGMLGLVVMIGLSRRLGGLGVMGLIGLVIMGLGVLAGFVATWAIPLWMPMQGIGLLLLCLAALRSPETPRAGALAVGSSFLLGTVAFTVGNLFEIGWRDGWGDYPVAWFAGLAVGAGVLSWGLVDVGRWLAGEEPAEIDSTPVVA